MKLIGELDMELLRRYWELGTWLELQMILPLEVGDKSWISTREL
jgi:hypothetical protein